MVVALIRGLRHIGSHKTAFTGLSLLVFTCSVVVLARADLLPKNPFVGASIAKDVREQAPAALATAVVPVVVEEPVRIVVSSLGIDTVVANPTSTDIAELDRHLLKGAVRYPTSAKLGETGNVVLFGHSSYLPVVNNRAFKAFNGIQKLAKGDTITVYSAGRVYTYAVRSVAAESATNAAIPLATTGKVLTLATCDSFGAKSDRFVVTADFVESHAERI